MTGIFQDVHLEWGGKTYTIKSSKMMGAIASIERHITLKELYEIGVERGTVPLAAVASAYAAVLRYAGAVVQDEQIYQSMFGDEVAQTTIVTAVEGLMAMMMPPNAIASAPGNSNRRQRRAAARSSPKRTS